MNSFQIRRLSTDEIFSIIETSNILQQHKSRKKEIQFIFIKRYNAAIQLNIQSISYFFNYIYRVRTIKTYFIWLILTILTFFPKFNFVLKIIGLSFKIAKPNPRYNFKPVNVIFIEWHFLGIFDFQSGTVTHLLSKPELVIQEINEIECRKTCIKNGITNIPKLLDYKIGEAGFWKEEIAVNKSGQFISEKDFNKAIKILISIYKKTINKIKLEQYIDLLQKQLNHIDIPEFSKRKEELIQLLKTLSKNEDIFVLRSLTHGDFNKGQILRKNNHLYIIDWSEGGNHNIGFDLITITLNLHNKFSSHLIPKEIKELKKFFFKSVPQNQIKIYIAITLLEVLKNQYCFYKQNRGPYKRWLSQVSYFFNNETSMIA